jgi:hypothetical protein
MVSLTDELKLSFQSKQPQRGGGDDVGEIKGDGPLERASAIKLRHSRSHDSPNKHSKSRHENNKHNSIHIGSLTQQQQQYQQQHTSVNSQDLPLPVSISPTKSTSMNDVKVKTQTHEQKEAIRQSLLHRAASLTRLEITFLNELVQADDAHPAHLQAAQNMLNDSSIFFDIAEDGDGEQEKQHETATFSDTTKEVTNTSKVEQAASMETEESRNDKNHTSSSTKFLMNDDLQKYDRESALHHSVQLVGPSSPKPKNSAGSSLTDDKHSKNSPARRTSPPNKPHAPAPSDQRLRNPPPLPMIRTLSVKALACNERRRASTIHASMWAAHERGISTACATTLNKNKWKAFRRAAQGTSIIKTLQEVTGGAATDDAPPFSSGDTTPKKRTGSPKKSTTGSGPSLLQLARLKENHYKALPEDHDGDDTGKSEQDTKQPPKEEEQTDSDGARAESPPTFLQAARRKSYLPHTLSPLVEGGFNPGLAHSESEEDTSPFADSYTFDSEDGDASTTNGNDGAPKREQNIHIARLRSASLSRNLPPALPSIQAFSSLSSEGVGFGMTYNTAAGMGTSAGTATTPTRPGMDRRDSILDIVHERSAAAAAFPGVLRRSHSFGPDGMDTVSQVRRMSSLALNRAHSIYSVSSMDNESITLDVEDNPSFASPTGATSMELSSAFAFNRVPSLHRANALRSSGSIFMSDTNSVYSIHRAHPLRSSQSMLMSDSDLGNLSMMSSMDDLDLDTSFRFTSLGLGLGSPLGGAAAPPVSAFSRRASGILRRPSLGRHASAGVGGAGAGTTTRNVQRSVSFTRGPAEFSSSDMNTLSSAAGEEDHNATRRVFTRQASINVYDGEGFEVMDPYQQKSLAAAMSIRQIGSGISNITSADTDEIEAVAVEDQHHQLNNESLSSLLLENHDTHSESTASSPEHVRQRPALFHEHSEPGGANPSESSLSNKYKRQARSSGTGMVKLSNVWRSPVSKQKRRPQGPTMQMLTALKMSHSESRMMAPPSTMPANTNNDNDMAQAGPEHIDHDAGWQVDHAMPSVQSSLPFYILGTSAKDESATPHVLSPPLMESLQNFLPDSVCESNFWLKYSLVRDGADLISLLQNVRGSKHTFIAIETVDGEVFGSFTSSPWHKAQSFFGTGESFLWRMRGSRAELCNSVLDQARVESDIDVFNWTGQNNLVQLCSTGLIALGGGAIIDSRGGAGDISGGDGFGLVIDQDMMTGSSTSCATFGNPALCRSSESNGGTFEIANLEVWSLSPCFSVSDAERLEMSMLFLPQHWTEAVSE